MHHQLLATHLRLDCPMSRPSCGRHLVVYSAFKISVLFALQCGQDVSQYVFLAHANFFIGYCAAREAIAISLHYHQHVFDGTSMLTNSRHTYLLSIAWSMLSELVKIVVHV